MKSAGPRLGRRLVYDHQIFSSQRFGGISRYFSELARHLSAAGSWDVEVLALAHVNAYLPSLDPGIVSGWRVAAVPKTGRIRQAFDTGVTHVLLARNPPDLVHETYYARRASGPATVPSVVTVYDMIHEKFPQDYPAAAARAVTKSRAIQRAEHVICISESTRNDLMDSMPIDPSRVSVVHLGSSISAPPEESGPPKGLEGSQYLLYVGERGGHKNFSGLLSALSLRPSILGNYLLVLYGGGPITQSERARIRDHDLPESAIIHLGSDDTLLGRLYRHASALVYPSLYEGFGIPSTKHLRGTHT